jgi:hypothetical protein
VAGSFTVRLGLGRDGVVTVSGCLAGVREERGQARSGYTGTPLHARRGLGILTGTRRRGRRGAHGHTRVIPFQGIGSTGRDRSGGEVTSWEVDGGVLALLGHPRRAWRRPGRREVRWLCLCFTGLARVLAGWCVSIGGRWRRCG